MAFSIESRVPYLTPELANFCFSLPEEFVIDSLGTRKSVFRLAMADIVPVEILKRIDKIGFRTPDWTWIKNLYPWIEYELKSAREFGIPVVNTAQAIGNLRKMISGKISFDYYSWRVVNFIKWSKLVKAQFS
jgi:asparagine synthase (glutamine-hydrolysing)